MMECPPATNSTADTLDVFALSKAKGGVSDRQCSSPFPRIFHQTFQEFAAWWNIFPIDQSICMLGPTIRCEGKASTTTWSNNITIHIFLQNGSPRTACFVVRSFGWCSLRRQLHWRGMATACGWGAALAGSEFHQLTWWHISLIDIPRACMIWLNMIKWIKMINKNILGLVCLLSRIFLDHEIGLMWLTITFWMENFLWPRANMPDTGTRWWTSWGSSVQTFPMALHGSRKIIRWLAKESSNSPWRVISFNRIVHWIGCLAVSRDPKVALLCLRAGFYLDDRNHRDSKKGDAGPYSTKCRRGLISDVIYLRCLLKTLGFSMWYSSGQPEFCLSRVWFTRCLWLTSGDVSIHAVDITKDWLAGYQVSIIATAWQSWISYYN